MRQGRLLWSFFPCDPDAAKIYMLVQISCFRHQRNETIPKRLDLQSGSTDNSKRFATSVSARLFTVEAGQSESLQCHRPSVGVGSKRSRALGF